jgi:hypothetical protein
MVTNEGTIVICIDTNSFYSKPPLTVGKQYVIINSIHGGNKGEHSLYICNDYGINSYYTSNLFLNLNDYRNKQIEDILCE